MQPLATWLVARPLNGGLALALTWLLLPLAPLFVMFSGVVMTHIVLARGLRFGVMLAVATAAGLLLVALVTKVPASLVLGNVAIVWGPAIVLAALVRAMQSLTLTFQVSVIVSAAAVAAFFVALGDPAVYWNDIVRDSVALFREAGANNYADQLLESQAVIVPQMTMLMVFVGWSIYTLVLLLGYALYQCLPNSASVYGRFCDLNLGRVIAGLTALASVLAVLTGSNWMENVAFLILVTFWIQGLAILHWMHTERRLPALVLMAVYVLLIPLNALILIAFSMVGYLDAWFNFRARGAARQA